MIVVIWRIGILIAFFLTMDSASAIWLSVSMILYFCYQDYEFLDLLDKKDKLAKDLKQQLENIGGNYVGHESERTGTSNRQ